MSGEKPEERWSPAQTVSTIMLSFLSLLSDPNFSSPANVDANIDMKDNYPVYGITSNLADLNYRYLEKVKKLVLKSKQLAPPEIWDMIPHPDTDPIQREQQRDRILQELQPKDDTLDWMHYGDTEGDEELADFDLEDDYDEISGEAEEEGEGEEEEGEDKRKEKEEKEEKDRDYGNEVNDEEEDEDSTGAEEAREGKKRKREASEEDSVPVTTKKQKGQI
jgi:ubiquitin-conjugating enzyme E2 R